ncbi:MAG TPA: hypothetical protein VF648_15470 [Pyrinomonadaceae bacterium]|jgi:uncharacterized coiled-coil DUF342 family protein
MESDKVKRAVELIVRNQAEFSLEMRQLLEARKDAENRLSVLEQAAINLIASVTETNQSVRQLTAEVSQLVSLQKETNERLNALILMAERYLSRENGKS